MVCVGGADAATHYRDVFTLQWNNGKLNIDYLPPLPAPLANSAGVIVEDKLYIAGGLGAPADTAALNVFWRLDLSQPEGQMAWEALPSLPGEGRMLSVAATQEGNVYVFSGVAIKKDNTGAVSRAYLKDAWQFDGKAWRRIADLPHAVAAAPSPAFTSGQSHIAIFGGDDGTNAHRVMELKEKHPGFRQDILAYHTITKTWSSIGTIGGGASHVKAPVTTPLVYWNGKIVLPGGEVRPGVRTTQVLTATLNAPASGFKLWDWLVLAVYFLVVIGISIYVSKTMQASTSNFFLGGQKIPWWAAGLSIFGSKLSALTFIAIPAKAFATDWVYIFGNLMIVAVAPLVVWFFLPYFRKLKITSVYEYLAIRFNERVKLLGSFTFLVFQAGRLGIVIYLPALVLSTVTGIDLILCVVVISVITTAYSIGKFYRFVICQCPSCQRVE
jgi:hypothetical protein